MKLIENNFKTVNNKSIVWVLVYMEKHDVLQSNVSMNQYKYEY